MPDERLGERACAFVVAADGAVPDLDAVRAFLDDLGVAKQYWPERVEAVEQLPRNPTGKVQKFLLRDRARQLAPATDKERVPCPNPQPPPPPTSSTRPPSGA